MKTLDPYSTAIYKLGIFSEEMADVIELFLSRGGPDHPFDFDREEDRMMRRDAKLILDSYRRFVSECFELRPF